eukprot:1178901-Prorocentrum_minimum.AAC.7
MFRRSELPQRYSNNLMKSSHRSNTSYQTAVMSSPLSCTGEHDAPLSTALDVLLRLAETDGARTAVEHLHDDGNISRLSYRELALAVVRTARMLSVDHDVGRGHVVGIAIPDGPDMVVAELSTWGTGAAIVPLDPCDAPDRLSHIMVNSSPTVIICRKGDVTRLTSIRDVAATQSREGAGEAGAGVVLGTTIVETSRVIPPDVLRSNKVEDGCEVSQEPETDVESIVRPIPLDSLSHIFYTSGSTGQPKGCRVKHISMAAYAHAKNAAHRVDDTARVFIASALTFDPQV